ncbi:MAG: metal-dependent hydrolase, partial [Kiritimatiellaeota bacterium]|nr:metal-dependent hydrolase [Kiritimatiellota bacterium]
MKGIAHFSSGVAAASFFPWSVQAAAEGNPLYFILGGAFGLLPDTVDFKFYRFFYRHHVNIAIDPQHPDPQGMAEAVAGAIGRALAEQRSIRVKMNSLRLGADSWRQYKVRFDATAREVIVHIGPIVSTGQVPVPGTEPKLEDGRAPLPGPVQMTYDIENKVDIFDGPTVSFEPDGHGGVIQHFLPWHRNWSHSLVMGALFGAVGALIWDWRAAAVIFAGNAVHVLED